MGRCLPQGHSPPRAVAPRGPLRGQAAAALAAAGATFDSVIASPSAGSCPFSPKWGVGISDRAPAYRDPALHFDALRLVALREGDRIEEALEMDNERKFLYAHLRTYTHPAQLLAAGASLQPTPSPLCELA